MDLTTLKAHIKSGKFDSFYIFTGPEVEVMRIYMKQIAKTCGGDIKNLDSITDLAQKIHSRTVLQNRAVFVIRDSKDFLSDERLQAKITQKNAFGDDVVLFVYTSIDKRSRLYKNYQDHIVEFEPLRADVLVKYIQREIPLSETNCHKLIEVCESDYSRILLEIDKIKNWQLGYGKDKQELMSVDGCFVRLLGEGVIYKPPKDAVFDFVDAVLRGHKNLAFSLLEETYACGEVTMVILANLYNSAKQLLQVQSYKGDGKITEATGLTPFQVRLASGRRGYMSNGDLVYLMRAVRNAEVGIKTGQLEEAIAVPYVLVNLW